MTTRVKCNRCDRMILESTAKANNGFCGVCVEAVEEGFWSRSHTDNDEIRRKLYAYITG